MFAIPAGKALQRGDKTAIVFILSNVCMLVHSEPCFVAAKASAGLYT